MGDNRTAQKVEHMRQKSAEYRRLFGLPDSERVIQDYACSMRGSLVGGRIYISQNYICFLTKLPAKLEKIAFRKVKNVSETKFLIHTYITLDMDDKSQFMFGSFWKSQHYNEALCLIRYLWNNPPSYVSMAVIDEHDYKTQQPDKSPVVVEEKREDNTNPFGGIAVGTKWDTDDDDKKDDYWNSNRNTNNNSVQSNGVMQQSTVQVDTQATKQAIKILLEAQQIGADTMSSLADQAEIIDKIEQHTENIHYNLDKGERLLRGIESLPAYLGNSFSKKDKERIMLSPKDRRLVIQKGKAPPMQIEILCKLPNCDLIEAILLLDEDTFSCVNAENKLIRPEYTYRYADIDKIIIRARPEHCDIRFRTSVASKERFRLMSSYLQILTTELLLRAPKTAQGPTIQVLFDDPNLRFDFGNPRISLQPPLYTRAGPTNGFYRKENQIKTSALLQNASEETKQALDEVDKDLDDISGILTNIGGMAVTMGNEIERQNEQLTRVTQRTDEAYDRVRNANIRIDRIIT